MSIPKEIKISRESNNASEHMCQSMFRSSGSISTRENIKSFHSKLSAIFYRGPISWQIFENDVFVEQQKSNMIFIILE